MSKRDFTRGGGGISAPRADMNVQKKGGGKAANVRNRGGGGEPASASGPNSPKAGSGAAANIRNRGGGGSIGKVS